MHEIFPFRLQSKEFRCVLCVSLEKLLFCYFIFIRTFLFWIWIFLFFSVYFLFYFFYQGFHFLQNFASETCTEVQKLDESKWWKAHFMSLDIATQHVMDFFSLFFDSTCGRLQFFPFFNFSFFPLSFTHEQWKCWMYKKLNKKLYFHVISFVFYMKNNPAIFMLTIIWW